MMTEIDTAEMEALMKKPGPIATIAELRAFWTAVMRDVSVSDADRLFAAELLGRSVGAFVHLEIVHTEAETKPAKIEAPQKSGAATRTATRNKRS
jgi:hypothetical protein